MDRGRWEPSEAVLSVIAAPLLAVGLAVSAAAPPPTLGLHVPWAAGGAHYDQDGQLTDQPEPWPGFDVPAVRLWDTRTTWANLEPRDNAWSFAHLDAHLAVAESKGTDDVLLVLAGTPAWAAREPEAEGAPWLPRGSASPPRDLEEWREYVRTVATRYAGRIDAYQIGNEPNLEWFWQGSRAELARLVRAAVEEIHRADPQATVIAPAPIVTTPASAVGAARWWRAMAGTGVDALAVQWYPPAGTRPAALAAVLERLRDGITGTHIADLPVWITEVNHVGDNRRAKVLIDATMRVAREQHVERVYWYAWTAIGPPALLALQPGSPAARALRDYAETSRVRAWVRPPWRGHWPTRWEATGVGFNLRLTCCLQT